MDLIPALRSEVSADYNTRRFESPLVQPPQSDEVADWLQATYARFKNWRRKYDQNWGRWLNNYLGYQWPQMVPQAFPSWKSQLVINYTRAIIHNIVAVAMDNNPKMQATSPTPLQSLYLSGVNACFEEIFNTDNVNDEGRDALVDACVYGIGYLHTWYDKNGPNGQGRIRTRCYPPELVYPEPGVPNVDDMTQMILERDESETWIDEFFPELAEQCKATSSDGASDSLERRRQIGYNNTFGGSAYIEGPFTYAYGGDDPRIADKTQFTNPPFAHGPHPRSRYKILEMYCKDASLVENTYRTMKVGYDGAQQPYMYPDYETRIEPRYKTGWRHIMACNRVTLVDEESPYDFLPIIPVQDQPNPHEFFSMGECQQLEALQFELNKRRSQMTDHAVLNGGSVWLVDKQAEVTRDQLDNKPNQIIMYNRTTGQEVQRLPGVPMPRFFLEMVEITIRDMHAISMVSTAGGTPPKAARSGAAFEAAQAMQTMGIRMRTRNVEKAYRQLGRCWLKMIQRYYTEIRWIMTTGHNGFNGHIPFDGKNIRGDWGVEIVPGSTMNQNSREQLYLNLAQRGLVDQVAVLSMLNIPDWPEIVARMQHYHPPMPHAYAGYPGASLSPVEASGYAASLDGAGLPYSPAPAPPAPGASVPQVGAHTPPVPGNPHHMRHGR